jgi:hypothetical protein
MKNTLKLGSLLLIAAATGCATNSPTLRTESSTSAIRAAEEIGASDSPRAAFHLEAAQEELARAKVLAENGDNDQAGSLLLRAEADAELAILLSREQNEKADATLAVERVRKLQSDNR